MTQIFTSPNLDEEEAEYDEIYIKKEHKIFKVIYYKDLSLFTNIEIDLKEALIDSKKFRIKTHSSERQARFTYNDNMRTVIKRRFFNTYLINALNEKLKIAGYKISLKKIGQSFVSKVSIENEKKINEMNLFQIFGNKEYYIEEASIQNQKNTEESNFGINQVIIQKIKSESNPELIKIFNKTFQELYEEYVNSKEFMIEIERLKKEKKKSDEYINKYKYLAKQFIEFGNQKID